MITAFVDMLGLAMVIRLLPFYATKLGASPTVVGVLVAAFGSRAMTLRSVVNRVFFTRPVPARYGA
jgi:hypothetical protein